MLEDFSKLLDLIHHCVRFLRGKQTSLINLECPKNLMLLLYEPLLELLDPFSKLSILMVKVVVLSREPIELEA